MAAPRSFPVWMTKSDDDPFAFILNLLDYNAALALGYTYQSGSVPTLAKGSTKAVVVVTKGNPVKETEPPLSFDQRP